MGQQTELARSDRLRGGAVSPDGAWLAYFIALSEDRAQNGLWLVRTDGTQRRRVGRPSCSAPTSGVTPNRLLVIPFQPAAVAHALWEFDVRTGATRRLTDPDLTALQESPTTTGLYHRTVVSWPLWRAGTTIIWLLTLPE